MAVPPESQIGHAPTVVAVPTTSRFELSVLSVIPQSLQKLATEVQAEEEEGIYVVIHGTEEVLQMLIKSH